MSEPRPISPLLDGYRMGDPISEHDGVRCCPSMRENSDNKYIVKILSVPAAQEKLEALLLAGAFSDRVSALAYFLELSQGVMEEAAVLQRLSRLEGFVSYDGWQSVPMEDGATGFDVYLVGAYRSTLERFLRRNPMTHLGAVNLGLDLCSALAVSRRSGYLYADLKPGNICICDDREYRICDLGFVPLSSLAYASLPDKYISAYTPPEITDAYSSLNATMDTYAVGLILYQVYNNGVLPFDGRAGSEPLPPPPYADYEMAQIILKACDPDPEKRWQDPLEMGQALVGYLQRNSVNDDPIIPPPAQLTPEPPSEEPLPEDTAQDAEDELSTSQVLAEAEQALASVGVSPEPSGDDTAEDPAVCDPSAAQEDMTVEETEADLSDASPETEQADVPTGSDTLGEDAAVLQQTLGVSEEVSRILAQADDLIAHETPEPVVAPEAIDVPMPDPILPEEPELSGEEETPEPAEEEVPAEDADEPEAPASRRARHKRPKKSHKGILTLLICLVLAAALGVGGFLYYNHIYLQPIAHISLSGEEDRLTVSLDTAIRDELLSVVCTDTYGTTVRQPVQNAKASFTGLQPSRSYKITVQISGFHRLTGAVSATYATPEQTSISNLLAITGTDDNSVILSFTVQGTDANEWRIFYSAQGEEEQSVNFTGHMVVVNGLTVGKRYTFRLEPAAKLYLVGENTVEFDVTGILRAENLRLEGFHSGALTAIWEVPEGAQITSWTAHCYNDTGYDQTLTVTEPKAVFEELDSAAAYTVEITAANMSVGVREYVSAGSVTIQSVDLDSSDPNKLRVRWTYEGNAPSGGWLLLYTLDGSTEQQVVQCSGESGDIAPILPGSRYDISILPASGATVFGGTATYTAPEAAAFSGYLLTAADISMQMCRTPAKQDWLLSDVPAKDFTTAFAVGERASFAVRLNHEYNTSSDEIVTLFVFRDSSGNLVSASTQSQTWTSMWYRGFGRINLPALPTSPGAYTVDIYFNAAHVLTQSFTIEPENE